MTPQRVASGSTVDTADRLQRVVSRLNRVLRQQTSGELTHAQLSALATICRLQGCRVGELAAHEAIGAPVATRVVASLEELGFVERRADNHDGRACLVHPTDAGTQELLALRRERAEVLVQRMQQLSADDRALLARAVPLLEALGTLE